MAYGRCRFPERAVTPSTGLSTDVHSCNTTHCRPRLRVWGGARTGNAGGYTLAFGVSSGVRSLGYDNLNGCPAHRRNDGARDAHSDASGPLMTRVTDRRRVWWRLRAYRPVVDQHRYRPGRCAGNTHTLRRSTGPSPPGSWSVRRGRRHSRRRHVRVHSGGRGPRRRHRPSTARPSSGYAGAEPVRVRRGEARRTGHATDSARAGARLRADHRRCARYGAPVTRAIRLTSNLEARGWHDVGALVRARADAVDDPTRWFDPPGVLP